MSKVVLALCLLAAGAAQAEPIVPTMEESQVSVVLKLWDSQRGLVRACMALGVWPGLDESTVLRNHPAPGCNAYNHATKTCYIHTMRPSSVEDSDRVENAGHELLHCFLGTYHKQD